jgi:hypothetical protein
VILQLFINSIYMVGGPVGEKKLPCKVKHGVYHMDGSLVVAYKQAVKGLVGVLLGSTRKLFLTALARYWV